LVAVGVTTLIGVFSELTKASEDYQTMADDAKNFRQETEGATAASKEQLDVLHAQREATPGLINRLYELNDAEHLSNEQKTEMANIVARLNTQYDGLGLAIDGNSGKLNMNKSQLESNTKALFENAEAQAKQELFIEATKNQIKAENDRATALEKVKEALVETGVVTKKQVKNLSDEAVQTLIANEGLLYRFQNLQKGVTAYRDTDAVAKDCGNTLKQLGEDIDAETYAQWANTAAKKEGTAAIEEGMSATGEAIEKVKELGEAEAISLMKRIADNETLMVSEQTALDAWKNTNADRATVLEEAVAREKELQDARVDVATNANDRIKISDQTSLAAGIENINKNTDVVKQYTDDMDYLYGKIPDSVRGYLEDAGISQARIVSEMRDDMENGGGEIAQRFVEAYVAALEAGNTPIEAAAIANGTTTDNGVATGIKDTEAATDAANEEIRDIAGGMKDTVSEVDFTYVGMGIINELKRGMTQARDSLYDRVDEIISGLKSRMKFNGAVSVRGGGTSASISVDWYDKGGYFTQPSFIGIAEKRPEFVGAADDLESFIGAAVNNAFVGVNPALLHDVSMPRGGDNYGGDTVYFNPTVTINTQKLTDAELRRATDFTSREFARMMSGRKVGKLRR
ncbi:MAG: hypothetical protein RR956_08175, partial [Christensenella sp.]